MIVRILSLFAALLVVNGLLVLPRWLSPGGSLGVWVALEAAFVVGLLMLLPPNRWGRLAVRVSVAAVIGIGLLGLADGAARLILARPLNLYVDLRLGRAILSLLYGNAGVLLGTAVVLLALGVVAGVGFGLTRLLRPSRIGSPDEEAFLWNHRLEPILGVALMLPLAFSLFGGGRPEGVASERAVVGTPGVDLLVDQSTRLAAMLSERENFGAVLAEAPVGYADVPGLFEGLGGRDVVLGFIESYGISALDDPRYGALIMPRLAEMQQRIEGAGLSIVSGTLVAPTQGGESWFSHGSLLSGLWLANQIRYDLMVASERETLVDDFERAGYQTIAVMPAITYAWPEGEALGYDTVYGRDDIPYAGPPLNWVTMPDQFVWHFVNRDILGATSRPPVFAEVGLISSHAPWTPVLEVLEDWDQIGDGRVFERWRGAGEAPEVLWLDPDRVRDHYARSVDYALEAMTGFAERYVDDGVLLIAMGDHQPAPLITGDGATWQVPVHVISADPALLEPFVAWGFQKGAVPSRAHPDRGMDYFRDWFVHAYSATGAPPPEASGRRAYE